MEFLKEILGDELYAQVSEKLKGNKDVKLANLATGDYISKVKFDALETTKKDLEAQLANVNTDLTTLNTQLSGQESLQATVTALQATISQKDTEIKQRDEAIKQRDFSDSVKAAVASYKPKNPDKFMRMLELDKLSEKDGKIVGLEEQIKSLQQSDAYLFADSTPNKGGTHIDPTNVGFKNPFAKESMNVTEQGKLFKENPAMARDLASQAGIKL